MFKRINKLSIFSAMVIVALCAMSFNVFAQEATTELEAIQDYASIVWLSICCGLVLFMQAGFLLVEGGVVRSKNAINVVLKNFTDVGIGTVGFWLIGYGLMYGTNETGWIGLSGFAPTDTGTSASLDLLYNTMFAATAATIMSGAVAERFYFLPYVGGALVVTTVVYPIFGSWAWSDTGWLAELGFHDSAGATVVHSIGGWCALGALILIGPRTGRFTRKGEVHAISGHNLPYVAIGGFILWFGWFGFNGGSVNEDFSNIGQILLNTHLGAVAGICGAIFASILMKKGFVMVTIVNGALGGLVTITAGVDVITAPYAILAGFLGGNIIVFTEQFLNKFRIDDAVGAVAVHGFCGAWGTLVVGLFWAGDMFNIERIIVQITGIVAALVWGLGASLVIFWTISKIHAIRVPVRIEQRGLDISEHKEIGYSDFVITHVKADS